MQLLFTFLLLTIIPYVNSYKKENNKIDGWELVWSDEFNNENIDLSSWTFDIGTGAPSFEEYGVSSPYFTPKNFPNDNFSVRWEGQIKIDQSSTYTAEVQKPQVISKCKHHIKSRKNTYNKLKAYA